MNIGQCSEADEFAAAIAYSAAHRYGGDQLCESFFGVTIEGIHPSERADNKTLEP